VSLFTITIALFLIFDSVGNITDFLTLMHEIPPKRQRWILIREMLIALGITVLFYFFGSFLLEGLEVNPATLRMAGGLVMFMIAIKMIFPSDQRLFVALDKGEPFIVPIATPMIAGPSILATVMVYAHSEASAETILSGIGIAWALSVGVFWFAYRFKEKISTKVLTALERLMGLILTLMAVEMFLKGLRAFIIATRS
jgi:multiple antibiotic resistance protein